MITHKSRHQGKVFLVGAGPGDPELLTIRAHRLLQQADIVLHDDLVSAAVISFAGPRAIVINVGKRCGIKRITQAEINALMVDAAHAGRQVVRLKSGDPAIFGRLNEELEALHAAKIACEIVPGVTAANAAAASLGVSLTDRRKSSGVVFISGHQAGTKGPADHADWPSLAKQDATIVVYMPGSNFRHLRKNLIASGLAPETSSVVVAQASTPNQKHFWTTLGELSDSDTSASPSILLIGRALDCAASRASVENLSGDEILQALSHPKLERRITS